MSAKFRTFLQVSPLALVLFVFLVVPLVLVLVVSVYRFVLFTGSVPDFTFDNYIDVLGSAVNLQLYLSTLKFTVIVLAMQCASLGGPSSWLQAFLPRSNLTYRLRSAGFAVPAGTPRMRPTHTVGRSSFSRS